MAFANQQNRVNIIAITKPIQVGYWNQKLSGVIACSYIGTVKLGNVKLPLSEHKQLHSYNGKWQKR